MKPTNTSRNRLFSGLALAIAMQLPAHGAALALVNTSFEFDGSGASFTTKTDQYDDGGPDIDTVGIQGFTLFRSSGGDIGVEDGGFADNPDNAGIRSVAYFSNGYVEQVTPFMVLGGTYTFTLTGAFTNADLTLIGRNGGVDTILASGKSGIVATVPTSTTDTLVFRIGSNSGYLGADTFAIDFVPAAIPEPTAALLSTVGALALLRRRRV